LRIVDIRETVVPIKSQIRNAFIDFSLMTVSVLALVTDVVRGGKPVVGFGFNSNGRYAPSGLLRDRFIPRLKAADCQALLNDAGDNLDPARIWDVLMRNEKPGGTASVPSRLAFWIWLCGTPSRKSREFPSTGFSAIAIAAVPSTQESSFTPREATTIPARI
jgi:hypothetical protein